jgi:hypothetical protein
MQEESLAPIMPARHAKWFIVGGIVLGVLLLGWGVKSFFFSVKNETGKNEKGKIVVVKEREDAESDGQQEEGTGVSPQETTAALQPDAVTAAAEDALDAEGQPSPLLEGLMAAKDAAEDVEAEAAAPVEAKPETVTITLNVTPSKAVVHFDEAKARKPYKFKVEKSDQMHQVMIEYKGYAPWSMSIPAQENKIIDVALQKIEEPKAPEKPEEEAAPKPQGKKTKVKKGGKKGKKKGGLVEDVPF